MDSSYRDIRNFTLAELFFNQDLVTSSSIDNFVRGHIKTLMKEKNQVIVDEIRNLLITGHEERVELDLFSLNIQRGRDHGIPTYNALRQASGLSPITSFEEILPAGN